jgi:hypothetical protein
MDQQYPYGVQNRDLTMQISNKKILRRKSQMNLGNKKKSVGLSPETEAKGAEITKEINALNS